ncbi:Serine/threonine-protein kinase, partial [Podochytrium sp. JEL0797]
TIWGNGTFIGARRLEEYILPLIVQSLTDPQEFVVEKVLSALTSLAELGLFENAKVEELVAAIVPLLCHPSLWIRYGAVAFVSTAAQLLPLIDVRCVLYPALKPFLRVDVAEVTEVALLYSLKSPLSRVLYDQALLLASKSSVVSYKKDRVSVGTNILDLGSEEEFANESTELILRLREFGMTDEDREKLFALKYYISKSTERRGVPSASGGVTEDDRFTKPIITPQTVFLTPPKYINPSLPSPPRSISSASSDTSSLRPPGSRNPSSLLAPRPPSTGSLSVGTARTPEPVEGVAVQGPGKLMRSDAVETGGVVAGKLARRGGGGAGSGTPRVVSSLSAGSDAGRSGVSPVPNYAESEAGGSVGGGASGKGKLRVPSVGYATSSVGRGAAGSVASGEFVFLF